MSSAADPPKTSGTEPTGVWSAVEQPLWRDLTGATLGDFFIERILGRGGMGDVYLARQVSLNRPVAIKVLRPELSAKPTYLGRFETEAAAIAKLNHPNIVHVYMLGQSEEIRFIAMEYVQGMNLREYITRKGSVDLPLAMSIMKQAGMAIAAAGEVGLIHRDIKPENLLLTKKGQVKVADFGLCRPSEADNMHLTLPGTTMGTPLYMSPEQAQGHTLDHRSDLYSLGVTFYHMLAGEPPFKADNPLAIALKHVRDKPVSLAVHRPDLPADLVALVMKLIEKKPADRYQSAGEMLRDLAKVRDSMQTAALAIPGHTGATGVGPALAATEIPAAPGPAVPVSTRGTQSISTVARTAAHFTHRITGARVPIALRVALVVLCAASGVLAAVVTRPDDLLRARSDAPNPIPALWMRPDWSRAVSKKANVEAQYTEALLRVNVDDQDAAWLAVPGYFPDAREWAGRAYVQFARRLLRRRDAERLQALADEVAVWQPDHTHEKELVALCRIAVKALRGDREGVIEDFRPPAVDVTAFLDRSLLEFGLEIIESSSRSPDAAPTDREISNPKLIQIRQRLAQAIIRHDQTGFRRAGGAFPGALLKKAAGETGANVKSQNRVKAKAKVGLDPF